MLAFFGTNLNSTICGVGRYYLLVCLEGFFEGVLMGSPESIFILQQYLSVPFRAKMYLTEVELLVHLMGVVLDSAGCCTALIWTLYNCTST